MLNENSSIAVGSTATNLQPRALSPRCKIALYGFGSQPLVHRYLIDLARKDNLPLAWCAILTTPYYRSIIGEVLAPAEILDVYRTLPRVPVGGDPACLSNYPGSLSEDLAAQKRSNRKRSGRWLFDRGIDYYRMYRAFLADRGATHVLMSLIEAPDAKIMVAAAQELGLGVITPIDLRNMTGTFFSTDCYETPPCYAVADAKSRSRAAEFVNGFRRKPGPARALPMETDSRVEDAALPAYLPPRWQRLRRFVSAIAERPDIFDPELLRIATMTYAAPLRKIVRGMREKRNTAQFDISDIAALPDRFIYYPLQFSPEASINTPAPYYVDQTRAIDALRFAMPAEYTLVVKEHPACIEMRPVKFMRRLRRLPGVTVVKYNISSLELIRRAALVATVTGTAAFEAFLLGRPAIVLGPGLAAWALGRMASKDGLRDQILDAINRPPPDAYVIDQVAKLMSVRYPFFFDTPHRPGEPMLRLGNIQRFLAALWDHLERERNSRVFDKASVV